MTESEMMKNDLLDSLIKTALYTDAKRRIEAAPSDDELDRMFPDEKRRERLLKKLIRIEKRAIKAGAEPDPVLTWLKRAAVIVMAVVSLSTAVMLTDTDIRAAVEHAVVEFFDKYAKINFKYSDDPGTEVDIYDFTVGYLPDGYELVETEEVESYRYYMYHNDKEDSFLLIDIAYTGNTESDVDIENTEISEITINGYNGYMYYSDKWKSGGIELGNQVITITVDGDFSREELLKIAESIK